MATAADFRYAHNDICSNAGYDHDAALTFCASDAVTGDPFLEIQYAGDTFRLTPSPAGDDYLDYNVFDADGDLVSCDREVVSNYADDDAEYPVADAAAHLGLSFLDLV
jgi:hypothetical protein